MRKSQISTSNAGRFQQADADPMVAVLQLAIELSGLKVTQIAADALCSYQTVQNIVDGKTRNPRNTTRDRILSACGVSQHFKRRGKTWNPHNTV